MSPLQNNSDHSSAADTDLWVFRDGRKPQPTRQLVEELQGVLFELSRCPHRDLQTDALIRAGELESALSDCGSPSAARLAALTEALAGCVCGVAPNLSGPNLDLGACTLPETVTVSPPEGFSYYALQPLEFAPLALRAVQPGEAVAVIGIRSIGTTLSAVVQATLRKRNGEVSRITVRPVGHPYDRQTRFDEQQLAWISQHAHATFLIVDEGPGRSGSTFLSVGEALLAAGIDQKRIVLLGSRVPDPAALCASAAAARWNQFKFFAVSHKHAQFEQTQYVGGGTWRQVFLPSGSKWPSCWPQMERLKFLSPDRKLLYKFEGLGRLGNAVRARAHSIADAGFGCPLQDTADGFSAYLVVPGSPVEVRHLNRDLIQRIAQYCAFRAHELPARGSYPDEISEMVRFNLQRELQVRFEPDPELLACNAPVFIDGRMQPWEWIGHPSGKILKSDGSTHGDDHFFPGPTHIAWDLAGASVEWSMDREAVECLLTEFQRLTGTDLRPRMPVFLLAYTVMRMAYSKMALSTVNGTAEELLLRRDYQRYRELITVQLASLTASNSRSPVHMFR